MKYPLGALAVLSVLSSMLVVATGAPSQASGFTARVSRATPIVGEYVRVSGAVAPANRVVQLQTVRGGRWVGVTSRRTGSGGSYAFAVRASAASSRYRVYAPKARKSAARASNQVGVRGVRPSLAFAGPVVDELGKTQAAATAMFSPARPGTGVRLDRWSGGRWVAVASTRQYSNGVARFGAVSAGTASSPLVYRAVAAPGGGVAALGSSAASSMRLSRRAVADDFSGSALSPTWTTRNDGYDAAHPCSTTQDGLVTVAGGKATFKVKPLGARRGCSKGAWAFPMITTGYLDRPYGYYAASVKFQKDRGLHGGFWLQGGTEVDFEHFGYDRPISNLLHTGFVPTSPARVGGDRPLSRAILGAKTPYTSYHTYSVQWSPRGYVFRLDGVPTLVTKDKNTTRPAEVILSLAVSEWQLPRFDPRKVNQPSSAMQVDSVTVWQ